MKRLSLLLLILCVLLAGCGAAASPAAPSAAPPTAAPSAEAQPGPVPTPAPEQTPLPSAEEQRRFLLDRSAQWYPEGVDYEPWFYAFTDLDHNGRLEVLVASTQGSGVFTWAECWEIDRSLDGLDRCTAAYAAQEGFAWPELIVDSVPCWFDPASGLYHHVFTDLTRDGAARYYETLVDVCLADGQLGYSPLASRETLVLDSGTVVTCLDAAGEPISEEAYEGWPSRVFAGMEALTQELTWTQIGAPAPEGEAAAEPPVLITKHPSGETLPVGGKTWFIAHADNADSLTWMLVDPEGVYYALEDAMAALPGLKLEVLPKDTLGVSDVPAALDGWGVVAWFFGPGGTAETDIAYIAVH